MRHEVVSPRAALAVLLCAVALTGQRILPNVPATTHLVPLLPANLPSSLLARRPDVRAAEAQIAAAAGDVGAARAALLPGISLTGAIGSASLDLDDLFTPAAAAWSVSAALLQPIFQGGRLRANVARTRAVQDQAEPPGLRRSTELAATATKIRSHDMRADGRLMLPASYIRHSCSTLESDSHRALTVEERMAESNRRTGRDLDRDPKTGQPEDHLGGMAGGAVAGGAAGGLAGAAFVGAATGTIAGGPLGTAVGAAVGVVAGSVLGGITGKALAERINPAHEDDYWRKEFPNRPYAGSAQHGWADYRPAYRIGYERYPEYHGRRFDEIEPEISRNWEHERGESRLSWDEARQATRDAYERIAGSMERAIPDDKDQDGK